MRSLYHMAEKDRWQACKEHNSPYFPPTYHKDGFIHLSADPTLLLPIANHFYREAPGEWVVLVIAPDKLSAEVKYEPAAAVGEKSSSGLVGPQQQQQRGQQGQRAAQQQQGNACNSTEEVLFPHLYGTIDFDAVQQELLMERGPDGTFCGVQGLAAA